MMGKLFQFVVVLIVALIAVSPVFGAGGLSGQDDFGLSSGWLNSIYTSSGIDDSYNSQWASGYFSLSVDPRKISIDWANWNFRVDEYDSSKWQANCYLNGLFIPEEGFPKQKYLYQNTNIGGVRVSESLDFYSRTWDKENPIFSMQGNISVYPATIDYSSFSVYEEQLWRWDPSTGESYLAPGWRGQYTLQGHFLADTPEGARALGAQFAQGVPEPSTVCLLGMFALSGAIILFRRRYWKI